MTNTLSELITYHQKKCDWFRHDKDRRQFHERMLRYLMEENKDHDPETGELFNE